MTTRTAAARLPIERGINPIIVKELRSRMRGARAFITLTVALLLIAGFSFVLYRLVLVSSQFSYSPLSPQIGQTLFAGLSFLELMIISTITPAITAGAISGEKEKQTYEMLLATPLHPFSILWGKLISALGYVFLMIFAAVPMLSLIFIFGGMTTRDMLKTLALLTVIAVMFGVIGMFMSAVFGRTGRATAAAYLVGMVMLFGPILIGAGISLLSQSGPPRWLLAFSPLSALASAFSSTVNLQNISSMINIFGYPMRWMWGAPEISLTEIPRPIYHYSLPLFGGITLVLYAITTRLVRSFNRWRIQWSEILVVLIVTVGFIGLIYIAYLATAFRYENFLLYNMVNP